ncbi:MAG: efflux RND transporter periplasmic adaptor subunit [Candidatus Omnitrophica bacterium]|nr:efflux RND transporter periplasmic adaptor subunit [Candidatus Omnitrophota bacterium]
MKKVFWIIIVLFLVMLVVRAILAKKKATPPPSARSVTTALATQKDVPIYVDSFGNLYPINDVNIESQVTGEIDGAHFTEGREVKKGDLLFTIDPSPFRADLVKAEAALAQDTADLNLKKITFERNEKLLVDQLISQQEYDTVNADYIAAQGKIKFDKATIELAKINLGYCSITSPIDGLTGKRQVDPGNIVQGNAGPTLVNIKTIDPLYLDFTVPEGELRRVREASAKGQLQVEIIVPGDEENVYPGELSLINNTVDNSTGTIFLRAIVENKRRKLWPGEFVKVRLILGIVEKAVVVPYEAVQMGQNGNFVFVVEDDHKADLRLVTTGQEEENLMVIEKGVKAGEKVVTTGQMGLSAGVSIQEVKDE